MPNINAFRQAVHQKKIFYDIAIYNLIWNWGGAICEPRNFNLLAL